MSIKKSRVRIIHWTDPDYLEKFYEGWGAGQSLTSRQAARCEVAPPDAEEPRQAPDTSQPSQALPQGHDSATSESKED